ncbi:nmrA-like family domain-containing protein [Hirsutella rhossiliensis]|uniref:NmrA-like family domain-containing protein n=1 Tax=Hirsutella rhossiliensis TaxID=111463 RepID=A0A9P8N3U8_9HYPO|nr:nmrA-like family domain-containing protein [Hirsutella rhossiliensis]KAH0964197.1 nmrA-like family domain-containing protein [Hirsutella rhossiliensis]
MSKILTVFGATGNQGGSVVRAILGDAAFSSQFKIRAVTRNATKPAARALQAMGAKVVAGNMSTFESVAPALQGAHTVFLATNFWESTNAATEISQGKAVADAAKAAGVNHFDSKAKIEQYIRDSGIPSTFVLPGWYASNFFQAIQKSEDGSYLLPAPVDVDKAKIPILDVVADTGKFVKAAIKHHPKYVGKHIYAATNYYSPSQLLAEFSEEMLENFLLTENPGYYGGAGLSESLSLLDETPTTWREFVDKNKAKWL